MAESAPLISEHNQGGAYQAPYPPNAPPPYDGPPKGYAPQAPHGKWRKGMGKIFAFV